MLRERRPDLRIVHFTHTPFCGPDDIRVLPDRRRRRALRVAGVRPGRASTPNRWARVVPRSRRATVLGRGAAIAPPFAAQPRARRRRARRRSPAAPTPRAAADALDDVVGDRLVIVRTDRIEPSKNIVRGFLAYDRLLEARPGLRGRVVFVAMLYPSRQGLAEYLAYANEVEQVVARVNDRWATRDWQPIVLDDRDDFAAIGRRACSATTCCS